MKTLITAAFILTAIVNALGQDSTNVTSDSVVFLPVEVQAQFPGGIGEMMKFINKNKKYPKGARGSGIEGNVNLSFIVEKDGSISNIKVLKGLHPAIDAEAVRVIQIMPKWNPGQQGGRLVKSHFVIPIQFRP